MKNSPKISVCVPVYGTEKVLERCLLSVVEQDFLEKEVVIVNDASSGADENGMTCKEIAKSVLKKNKIPYTYIEHKNNLGTMETRRDLALAAKGEYIFSLDSDDYLQGENALSTMYEAAVKNSADILNTTFNIFSTRVDEPSAEFKYRKKQADSIFIGELCGREILQNHLVAKEHAGFLCGKLIRREIFTRAFEQIPFTQCTMAEDLILYFFIALFSKKYFGIPERFYTYVIDEGISSNTKITDLARWERVCSASSVFAILSEFIANDTEFNLTEQMINSVKQSCNTYLLSSLNQLKNSVAPELQERAYEMLCDYWGKDYVEAIEKIAETHREGKEDKNVPLNFLNQKN